jgi:acyl-CoA reductase-like NAD-dependent aldehyde dehydrogenase
LRLFDLKPTAANTVIEILRKLAQLMDGRRDYLSCQTASEGNKPLADDIVETERAIGGVHNAIEILRNSGGWDQLATHPRPLP